jgi:Uma2 family endonuclease
MLDPTTRTWTYTDYVRLTDEGEWFEILDGEAFVNPQPTTWHQLASSRLAFLIETHIRPTDAGLIVHTVDVVFAEDCVLQPDIVFVATEHLSRIRKTAIFGAPDFVIELLSPSTASRDRREKLAVYARHGIREYWLVDPEKRRIEVFVLEEGKLVRKAAHDAGEARSLAVLPGFSAPLADVFRRP